MTIYSAQKSFERRPFCKRAGCRQRGARFAALDYREGATRNRYLRKRHRAQSAYGGCQRRAGKLTDHLRAFVMMRAAQGPLQPDIVPLKAASARLEGASGLCEADQSWWGK